MKAMEELLNERERGAPLRMDHGSTIVRVNITEVFGVIVLGIIALVLLRALLVEIERSQRAAICWPAKAAKSFEEGR